jgi:hypothetical protein
MNKVPNGSNVIVQLLGKRQSLAHEAGDSLTQGAVKSLNVVGFTAFLPHCKGAACWVTPHHRQPRNRYSTPRTADTPRGKDTHSPLAPSSDRSPM